jgi:bacteriorhodopsin
MTTPFSVVKKDWVVGQQQDQVVWVVCLDLVAVVSRRDREFELYASKTRALSPPWEFI